MLPVPVCQMRHAYLSLERSSTPFSTRSELLWPGAIEWSCVASGHTWSARTGHNPKTGAGISVPETYHPSFRMGKEMRDRLNGTPGSALRAVFNFADDLSAKRLTGEKRSDRHNRAPLAVQAGAHLVFLRVMTRHGRSSRVRKRRVDHHALHLADHASQALARYPSFFLCLKVEMHNKAVIGAQNVEAVAIGC
jgi:hypothetical protein